MRVNATVRDEAEEMDVPSPLARACERGYERLVLRERTVRDRVVHALEVLEKHAARADREVTDLRVAHLPGRKPDRLTRRSERRVRVPRPERVEDRRLRELDGVPRARAARVPSRRG